jgi:hypothetical protein
MLIGDLNMSFPSPKNARTGCHNHPVPPRQESASSRAVGEYLRVSRMREPAESWLAANQAFVGRRFFIFESRQTSRSNGSKQDRMVSASFYIASGSAFDNARTVLTRTSFVLSP